MIYLTCHLESLTIAPDSWHQRADGCMANSITSEALMYTQHFSQTLILYCFYDYFGSLWYGTHTFSRIPHNGIWSAHLHYCNTRLKGDPQTIGAACIYVKGKTNLNYMLATWVYANDDTTMKTLVCRSPQGSTLPPAGETNCSARSSMYSMISTLRCHLASFASSTMAG